MSISSELPSSTTLPLCLRAKLSFLTLSLIKSPLGNQTRPPTRIDSPSFDKCSGGSSPENVNPLKVKPVLATDVVMSSATECIRSGLISPDMQSSMYVSCKMTSHARGNSSLLNSAVRLKAHWAMFPLDLTP